ncbi:50S ribosomal protein L2 [Frankliniella fusca]|uniref:50S ribosomal protein L2 n=1 Tax=Frankliniella fusca TaxID=407009 RepID=A0AAE1I113_9NEOP|nr:50S ribosomal protein L2 [Frankliniella fusca]
MTGRGAGSKVRYTTTHRGARKAIFGGYMYVFRREKKDGAGWRCDQRGKCLGRMTVLPDNTVLDEQPHSHAPDWGGHKEGCRGVQGNNRCCRAEQGSTRFERDRNETAMICELEEDGAKSEAARPASRAQGVDGPRGDSSKIQNNSQRCTPSMPP